MSIQAVGWVLEQDLPARPKLVLVAIANHANHVDGYCWLKAETIAAEAACSRRAVFNYLGALIRNGFIRKAPRRGDDGKQRSNDYWIILNREPSEWVEAGASIDEDAADDADDQVCETPQDVVEPSAQDALGESDVSQPGKTVDKPPLAPGPSAPACTHIESAEPSKIKPEEGGGSKFTPRSYRPPPSPRPQAQGEVTGKSASDPIFVFVGTPAYEAWARVMAAKNRTTRWHLVSTRFVNGEKQTGWYFPSLFPPAHADPPKETENH